MPSQPIVATTPARIVVVGTREATTPRDETIARAASVSARPTSIQ
jgi:hypothetical protein